MATEVNPGNGQMDTNHDHEPINGEDAEAARARMLRKRTKTGCLTCRKRRIKCGEERPICKNCIKSKRHCDGYNQRVVFKPQTVDFRPFQNGAASITFPAATMGMDINFGPGYPYQMDPYQATGPVRPRPIVPMTPSDAYSYSVPYTAPAYQAPWHGGHPLENPDHQAQMMRQLAMAQAAQQTQQVYPQFPQQVPPGIVPSLHTSQSFSMPSVPNGMTTMPPALAVTANSQWQHAQADPMRQASIATAASVPSLTMSSLESTPNWNTTTSNGQPPTPHTAPLLNNPWSSGNFPSQIPVSSPQPFISTDGRLADSPQHQFHVSGLSPTVVLEQAAVEYHDDDYYDVQPVGEPNEIIRSSPEPAQKEALALDHIVKLGDLQISHGLRSNYGYSEGILDNYRPEMAANPLKNPATARVFAHFVQVTGMTISAQTRRPLPPGVQKNRADVPFFEAGVWTHTMPMAALHDQGLLQAMLALSSLHIAKLTNASTTPSYKHYAYALKAVHHSVGHPSKRHNVETFAASILLAVYELWCAEHVKWSSHLAGAGQLLVETDFAGMHKKIRKLKLEEAAERRQGYPTFRHAQSQGDIPQYLKTKARQYKDLKQIPNIDSHYVSLMAGRVVNYDDYGHIMSDESESHDKHANLDIPRFEILKDLFWGFAKHDMIGSVISGNPLLLSYSRWTDCPPRAPINAQPGVIFGAYDHLILLCGRIADFSVRDRKRKLRAMQLNGGAWRPPPGMQMGPPGSSPSGSSGAASRGPPRGPPSNASAHSPQTQGNTPSPLLPPYFGMAPPGPTASMPHQYWSGGSGPSPMMSPEHEQMLDFSTATAEAISDWDDILAALNALVSMLGDWYQPLESEYHPAPNTPFGPGIIYKSLDVGCFWGFVNFAYILAHRSHPHMPPYSHMAAAIASSRTKQYANNIGRLAAGIMPPNNGRPITPFMGAAMCDLCLPLFFTGVQLVDPHQRDWVITALFDIERRCAYETAGTIAHGCQTAWHKAGKAGRGPPYTHRYNTKAADERQNGTWERIDPNVEPDQDDVTDRRFVHTKPAARLHWAMGILGTQEDERL
ncbi:fungal specific transcription factor domain-containing protein 11 [Elsinoe australis]|uniref:Fungal specific transcription factor domain-containing protein 11 n=1 Tax=Elsinoe australis TaxID=40998 RepID=A0A4U7BET9_9PEZI|nr:fungal specific transcription factor domain-containing protein 11 [Elsinoe australis]